MHEHVLAAVRDRHEAEALSDVIPFDRATSLDGRFQSGTTARVGGERGAGARRIGAWEPAPSSTASTSITWRPFCPWPTLTRSDVPGLTELCPALVKALACRKTSPDPSASATKPKPLSGLNHLTVHSSSGPKPTCAGEEGA